MNTLNFANTLKKVYLSQDAVGDLENYLSQGFSNKDKYIYKLTVQVYRTIISELNTIAGGIYGGWQCLGQHLWRKEFEGYGYFVVRIVTDYYYRKVIFIIENIFFNRSASTPRISTSNESINPIDNIISETINQYLQRELIA